MKKPGDDTPDPPGGRAAERLREFLEKRLPPGATPDDLNPDIADNDAASPSPASKKPLTADPSGKRKRKSSSR